MPYPTGIYTSTVCHLFNVVNAFWMPQLHNLTNIHSVNIMSTLIQQDTFLAFVKIKHASNACIPGCMGMFWGIADAMAHVKGQNYTYLIFSVIHEDC